MKKKFLLVLSFLGCLFYLTSCQVASSVSSTTSQSDSNWAKGKWKLISSVPDPTNALYMIITNLLPPPEFSISNFTLDYFEMTVIFYDTTLSNEMAMKYSFILLSNEIIIGYITNEFTERNLDLYILNETEKKLFILELTNSNKTNLVFSYNFIDNTTVSLNVIMASNSPFTSLTMRKQ